MKTNLALMAFATLVLTFNIAVYIWYPSHLAVCGIGFGAALFGSSVSDLFWGRMLNRPYVVLSTKHIGRPKVTINPNGSRYIKPIDIVRSDVGRAEILRQRSGAKEGSYEPN